MVAATARRQPPSGLQPFDPYRHLSAVVPLISQAFADELGPGSRAVLRRMQCMARWGGLNQWLWAAEAEAGEAPGFVWVEEGRVVGNASVRRASAPGGWLIGNVVVHPEWRGRSIGRALVEAAVEAARERGAAWVGLEVRQDNAIAAGMYERMGFVAVGTTVEMDRPAGERWSPPPDLPSLPLRRAGEADQETLYHLAVTGLSLLHREVLEVRPQAYRAGWLARIGGWLEGVSQDWWLTEEEGRVVGAFRLSSAWLERWHQVELLVAKDGPGPQLARAALVALSRRRPWEATVTLPGPRQALEPVFAEAGFRRMRCLVQMRLDLRSRRTNE